MARPTLYVNPQGVADYADPLTRDFITKANKRKQAARAAYAAVKPGATPARTTAPPKPGVAGRIAAKAKTVVGPAVTKAKAAAGPAVGAAATRAGRIAKLAAKGTGGLAAAGGIVGGVAQGLGTPTEDYAARLGIPATSVGQGFTKDAGIRLAGVAQDITANAADFIPGLGGPVRKFFNMKQAESGGYDPNAPAMIPAAQAAGVPPVQAIQAPVQGRIGAGGVPEFTDGVSAPFSNATPSARTMGAIGNLAAQYQNATNADPGVRDARNALSMGLSTQEYQSRRIAKNAARLRGAGLGDAATYEILADQGLLGGAGNISRRTQEAELQKTELGLKQAKELETYRSLYSQLNDQNDPDGSQRRSILSLLSAYSGRAAASPMLKTVANSDLSESLISYDPVTGVASRVNVDGQGGGQYSQEDLESTAQKYGISVDEVLRRLQER